MKNKIATLIISSGKVLQKQAEMPAMYQGNTNYANNGQSDIMRAIQQNSPTDNVPVPQAPRNKYNTNTLRLTPISGNNPFNLNLQDKTHQAFLEDMRRAAGLMGVKPQANPAIQKARKDLEPVYHSDGMYQGGWRLPPQPVPGRPHEAHQVYRVSYDPLEAQKAWDTHNQRNPSRFR